MRLRQGLLAAARKLINGATLVEIKQVTKDLRALA